MKKPKAEWKEWDAEYTKLFIKQLKEDGIPSFTGVSIHYANKQRLSQRLANKVRRLTERFKNAFKESS